VHNILQSETIIFGSLIIHSTGAFGEAGSGSRTPVRGIRVDADCKIAEFERRSLPTIGSSPSQISCLVILSQVLCCHCKNEKTSTVDFQLRTVDLAEYNTWYCSCSFISSSCTTICSSSVCSSQSLCKICSKLCFTETPRVMVTQRPNAWCNDQTNQCHTAYCIVRTASLC